MDQEIVKWLFVTKIPCSLEACVFLGHLVQHIVYLLFLILLWLKSQNKIDYINTWKTIFEFFDSILSICVQNTKSKSQIYQIKFDFNLKKKVN